eukprot:TRINITY_DN15921_c0_g1_i2.p1 TRINITY_DN15921_c0_g1~~TRINITY_DN15921_c0_g1_i2.p1  ORF type:complete len:278 (+),score=66.02 TRINITY_DN15921_c0_g1_i2:36-869(+)
MLNLADVASSAVDAYQRQDSGQSQSVPGSRRGSGDSKELKLKVETIAWETILGEELLLWKATQKKAASSQDDAGPNLLAAIGAGVGVQQASGEENITRVRTAHVLPKTLKLLLLYFSGRWCSICSQFDVVLREVYDGLKALPESADLELVWMSCDLSEEAYRHHLKKLGIVLGSSWSPKRIQECTKRWNLQAIPSLLVLDAVSGRVIRMNGREDIEKAHENTSTMDREGIAGLALQWLEALDAKRAAEDDGVPEEESSDSGFFSDGMSDDSNQEAGK